MVVVKSRSKKLGDVTLSSAKSLDGILKEVSEANGGINTNRLRLTYMKEDKHIPITSSQFFNEGEDKEVLYVKDLGPQISWRMVFVAEYLGPIIVHTLMYTLSRDPWVVKRFHSQFAPYDPYTNRLAYYLILLHYVKRELETIFVHSFSQSTMPLFNLFKNSFHYWVLNGAISLSYFGYGFITPKPLLRELYRKYRPNMIAFFLICELWNFYSHIQLRRWGAAQKKRGVTTRLPLQDGIFRLLVAPNYTFEVWAWIWFSLLLKLNLFAVVFLVVSAVQMYIWAAKKNKRYGTKRAFLVPFIF